MIKFVKNDITKAPSGVIVHCVNCQHAMGSGIARSLFTKWPAVRQRYMEQPSGRDMLGTTHIFTVEQDIYVANCYGQEFFGNDGRRYADPVAVGKCLEYVYKYAETMWLDVNIPHKMASDLAGLNWDSEVYPIIERLNSQHGVETIIWSIH